jgi:arylformamidase
MGIIWLSHIIDQTTPLYGGEQDLFIRSKQSLNKGDSCNTSILTLSSHAGTHVDAPYHFLEDGKTIDDFDASRWVFHCPKVIRLSVAPGHLIVASDIDKFVQADAATDILLLRTGFERYRKEKIYWKDGPGLSPDLADFMKTLYPSLRAVGIDFISISGFQHREEGRRAHKAFLKKDILLFEDMALGQLNQSKEIYKIVALPLRFTGADGAPCSVLGWERDV